MKKILLVIPMLVIAMVTISLNASAQTGNQSNANTPINIATGNQSNGNTPLLNVISSPNTNNSNAVSQSALLLGLANNLKSPSSIGNSDLVGVLAIGQGDTFLQSIISTIGTYSNPNQISSSLPSLTPDISGMNTQAVQAVSDAALGSVESHLEFSSSGSSSVWW
jgi:hypothetical protein